MMTGFWAINRAIDRAAERTAAAARAGQVPIKGKLQELQDALDRTTLVCEAMWTLLRDRTGLTEEDLVNRVNEIDLSDGKLDGKVRRGGVCCPSCGRTVARRFRKCLYCGQAIVYHPFA